jgi:hypothetical protein
MSVDQNPTAYYRTIFDTDTLYELDDFNAYDAVLAATEQTVPGGPTGDDALNKNGEMTLAQATEDEARQWWAAYARLRSAAAIATQELEAAERIWKAARDAANAKLLAAYDAYKPTHEAIERRMSDADDVRNAADAVTATKRAAAAQAEQAAEDNQLGPRRWVVKQVTDPYGVKKAPDMYVPTVHLADCPTLHAKPGTPLRAMATFQKIREGAPEARSGRKQPGTHLHTRLCGRCKPEASLREAIGEEFDQWLTEAESVQPPAPSLKVLQRELSAKIPWVDTPARRDGYCYVGADLYRKHSKVAEHELLLGWITHTEDGRRRVTNTEPDKLAALYDLLPPLGFAVRPLTEPNLDWRGNDQGGEERISPSAVAIRRMTAGERRARAATPASR